MLRWLRGPSRTAQAAVMDGNVAGWSPAQVDAPTLLVDAPKHAEDADACARTCQLSTCSRGRGALVVRVECPTPDACRLRALGVYEGAFVNVVDSRNGLLLEVRGSRIALGAAVAASIAVVPLP